jgi:hypothetical protein
METITNMTQYLSFCIHKRWKQKTNNKEKKWAYVIKETKFLRGTYSEISNYIAKYRWAIMNRFGGNNRQWLEKNCQK